MRWAWAFISVIRHRCCHQHNCVNAFYFQFIASLKEQMFLSFVNWMYILFFSILVIQTKKVLFIYYCAVASGWVCFKWIFKMWMRQTQITIKLPSRVVVSLFSYSCCRCYCCRTNGIIKRSKWNRVNWTIPGYFSALLSLLLPSLLCFYSVFVSGYCRNNVKYSETSYYSNADSELSYLCSTENIKYNTVGA